MYASKHRQDTLKTVSICKNTKIWHRGFFFSSDGFSLQMNYVDMSSLFLIKRKHPV